MSNPTPRELALGYIRRGWAPIPIPHREKNPGFPGWQRLRVTEETVSKYFSGNGRPQNIGVLHGEPSGGLADADLDSREALALAGTFLPATGAVFGRAGKPRSHRLYLANLPKKLTFNDPLRPGNEGRLLEVLTTGQQSVFPGSCHKETGEPVEWAEEAEPAAVGADELTTAAGRLAAAALLCRYWPGRGQRHDTALALAGGLLSGGWSEPEARRFVGAVARVAGDEEAEDREEAVRTTAARLRAGQEATGWTTLAGMVDAAVVARAREWTGAESGFGFWEAGGDGTGACGSGNGRAAPAGEAVTIDDFWAYMPEHRYLYIPTGALWPLASVNGRLPPIATGRTDRQGKPVYLKPATWLDRNRPVEQMTWCPGEPQLIEDRLPADGGWQEKPGARTFNLYIPPPRVEGATGEAGPWWDHLRSVYGKEDAAHITRWLAHRAQRPGEKVNHALVLGGAQGIGKDTILEPVRTAVGPWNFLDVSPGVVLGRFNSYVKSVVLLISEARDLGDIDRYAFYEHTKVLTAAPPATLRCDEKNLREYPVPNVCGVIITTNHRLNGLYLPEDDRRHYVAWSERTKEEFSEDYWRELWGWYDAGGREAVAATLLAVDLSKFDAKAPPPRTAAWKALVNADRAPEDSDLSDVLEALGWPEVVTIEDVAAHPLAGFEFAGWLRDRKNSRSIPHRFERAGYVAVDNSGQQDGRWKVAGKNVTLYGRACLSVRDRIAAARRYAEGARK